MQDLKNKVLEKQSEFMNEHKDEKDDEHFNFIQEQIKETIIKFILNPKIDDKSLDLTLKNLTNEKNRLLTLSAPEKQFLMKLLQLKPLLENKDTQNWTTETKNSIEKMSELVNITEKDIGLILSMVLLTNYDKILTAVNEFKIQGTLPSEGCDIEGYIEYAVTKVGANIER